MFWKPGTKGPGLNVVDRETEKEDTVITFNPNLKLTIAQQRERLPVFRKRNHILFLVENYPTLIVVGETGCGKTTQIPQYLHETGWTAGGRVVCCTQPRRVAATTVATRVAEEMGCELGGEVGYSIRFDDSSNESTRIKYMTDGMLVRETMLDPLLSKYSVIMLDEAHERSLHTDVLLGLLKKIQRRRKELRVIVSSATVDAEAFRDFFNTNTTDDRSKDTATIITVEGRMFAVETFYTPRAVADYIDATLTTILEIHKTEPSGDILAFLTGQEEIDTMVGMVRDKAEGDMAIQVFPLYAALPAEDQLKVFMRPPKNTRKIIIATNIAETSVTIEGIVYVVDCGFVKVRSFNPRTGMEQLVITTTSQASARQRSGRAGRMRGGKAYRLYTEDDYAKLRENNVPEIQRQNLASVVLQLKALGIDDVLHFDFMSPPPSELLIRALELLYSLGALDDAAKLTPALGVTMSEFPVDPMLAKMLLASESFGCSEEIASIAAMLSVQHVFLVPKGKKAESAKAKRGFSVYEGDHLTLLNVFNGFMRNNKAKAWCHQNYINFKNMIRAEDIRNQLRKYMRRFQVKMVSCGDDINAIRRCIVSGYFSNAATVTPSGDGAYRTVRDGQILHIHPTSVLFRQAPQWLVYHEVVATTKNFMRDCTTIDAAWLSELAPHFYDFKRPEAPSERLERTLAQEEGPPRKKGKF